MAGQDWINSDPRWQAMSPNAKAATMALLEAGRVPEALHVAGAMVNRANAERVPLEHSVSSSMYQPTFDQNAKKRFDEILSKPEDIGKVEGWIDHRVVGQVPDNVNGATHFLEHPAAMRKHEEDNPGLYKDWGPRGSNWTGYDPAHPDIYGHTVAEDPLHSFVLPAEHGGTLNYNRAFVPALGATGTEPTETDSGVSTVTGGASMAPDIVPPSAIPEGSYADKSNANTTRGLGVTVRGSGRALPGSPTPQPVQGNSPLSAFRQALGLPAATGAPQGSPHSLLNMATGGGASQGSVFQGLNALFGGGPGAGGDAAAGAPAQGAVPASVLALQAAPKPAAIAASPIIASAPAAHGWNPNLFAKAAPQGYPMGYLNMSPFTFGPPQG